MLFVKNGMLFNILQGCHNHLFEQLGNVIIILLLREIPLKKCTYRISRVLANFTIVDLWCCCVQRFARSIMGVNKLCHGGNLRCTLGITIVALAPRFAVAAPPFATSPVLSNWVEDAVAKTAYLTNEPVDNIKQRFATGVRSRGLGSAFVGIGGPEHALNAICAYLGIEEHEHQGQLCHRSSAQQ